MKQNHRNYEMEYKEVISEAIELGMCYFENFALRAPV